MAQNTNRIFILGPGKSGTTLIKILLDKHPELSVYPCEASRFLENYLANTNYTAHAKVEHLNFVMKDVLDINRLGNVTLPGLGLASFDLSGVDRNIFLKLINEGKEENTNISEYFDRIFKAFNNAISKDRIFKGYVLDATSEKIEGYLHYFPDAKIIFMIRNPFSCYNSFKKTYYRNIDSIQGISFPRYMPEHFFDIIYNSFLNLSKFKNDKRVLVVRLEDLQSNVKETMFKVADFLEISFNESLLKPTLLGKPYKGNTLEKTPENGKVYRLPFSDSFLTKQEKYLIAKTIPCGDYYRLECKKCDSKPIQFSEFMKTHGKWWQTESRFPKNIKKFLYGIFMYRLAYHSYLWYARTYFKRFNL